jgi:polar amino acid transport system substrate-binding protein
VVHHFYAKSEQFIISLKDFPVTDKSKLEGLRIGVKQGTSGHTLIKEMGLKKTNLLTYPTTLHTVRALLNNETEAVVIDQQTALWATTQFPQLQSNPLKDSTEYYGICVHKSNSKLLAEINTIIEEMTANGEIETLIEKHSSLF